MQASNSSFLHPTQHNVYSRLSLTSQFQWHLAARSYIKLLIQNRWGYNSCKALQKMYSIITYIISRIEYYSCAIDVWRSISQRILMRIYYQSKNTEARKLSRRTVCGQRTTFIGRNGAILHAALNPQKIKQIMIVPSGHKPHFLWATDFRWKNQRVPSLPYY